MNREWFHAKLHDQRKSLRSLADYMQAAPSSISRLLSGQRRMQLDEARQIALFLSVPVPEVLRQAGLELEKSAADISLNYVITETGLLKAVKPRQITLPTYLDAHKPHLVCASFQCQTGPLALWDDALAMFQQPQDMIQPEAVGHLAVVVKADSSLHLCHLERARRVGTSRLRLATGKTVETTITAATAVLAVLP